MQGLGGFVPSRVPMLWIGAKVGDAGASGSEVRREPQLDCQQFPDVSGEPRMTLNRKQTEHECMY